MIQALGTKAQLSRAAAGRRVTGATMLLVGMLIAQAPVAPLAAASIQNGQRLFSGQTPLANRGPACLACHSAAELPFPNGGTLGPDLTHVISRIGPEGVQSALKTLYFPAMVPLYRTRPLTLAERQDLAAFLRHADTSSPPAATGRIAGLAGLILVLLLLIVWWTGRGRLRGVRHRLVERARASAARGVSH